MIWNSAITIACDSCGFSDTIGGSTASSPPCNRGRLNWRCLQCGCVYVFTWECLTQLTQGEALSPQTSADVSNRHYQMVANQHPAQIPDSFTREMAAWELASALSFAPDHIYPLPEELQQKKKLEDWKKKERRKESLI